MRVASVDLPVNKPAAIKAVRALVKAPDTLLGNTKDEN